MTTRSTYTDMAIAAARTALTIADLRKWFRDEADNRMRHAVLPGTAEYDQIVAACAERKAELEKQLELAARHKAPV